MPTSHLIMVGSNHRQTSLAVRERLAFTPAQTLDALAAWSSEHADSEAVLISTCHRVEFYVASLEPAAPLSAAALTTHLAEFHNVPEEELRGQLAVFEDTGAVHHLFRVAASLDSMVVGEAQILSQVKQAYEQARRVGSTGPVTHGLFQSAIRVARRADRGQGRRSAGKQHPHPRHRRAAAAAGRISISPWASARETASGARV